jgi:two-component system nitrate/nitrite response regulator NarL
LDTEHGSQRIFKSEHVITTIVGLEHNVDPLLGQPDRLQASSTEKVSILVVDDHALVAETMVAALSSVNDFSAVAVEDVKSAIDLIEQVGPFDLILLDYDIPFSEPNVNLSLLTEANRGAVALFSGVAKRHVVERALSAGAVGFVPKTLHLKVLQHAIRLMVDGEIFLPSEFTRPEKIKDLSILLGEIEIKVLILLSEGKSNKEIARELGSDETVIKMHIRAIFRKLRVTNRTQAVLSAQKLGIC